jgi:hypothetical protein
MRPSYFGKSDMRLNVKNIDEFTVENFARLLASKDDTQNRQLRVSKSGDLYISDLVGNLELDDVKFAFETWMQGNDYCGPHAAADVKYVADEYAMVKTAWDKGLTGIIDYDPRFD